MRRRCIFLLALLLPLWSCQSSPDHRHNPFLDYHHISLLDRRMNMAGLVQISTRYLNEHPGEFWTFHRLLTEADDALGEREFLTRGGVMRWLRRAMAGAGYEEQMPVYRFLRAVYLEGWEGAYLNRVDLDEREYLYDLISAVMGGMHLCTTCSTEPESESNQPK
ncbi:MAG: hypothetical protein AB1515_07425 [Nitrospirota bacterium]